MRWLVVFLVFGGITVWSMTTDATGVEIQSAESTLDVDHGLTFFQLLVVAPGTHLVYEPPFQYKCAYPSEKRWPPCLTQSGVQTMAWVGTTIMGSFQHRHHLDISIHMTPERREIGIWSAQIIAQESNFGKQIYRIHTTERSSKLSAAWMSMAECPRGEHNHRWSSSEWSRLEGETAQADWLQMDGNRTQIDDGHVNQTIERAKSRYKEMLIWEELEWPLKGVFARIADTARENRTLLMVLDRPVFISLINWMSKRDPSLLEVFGDTSYVIPSTFMWIFKGAGDDYFIKYQSEETKPLSLDAVPLSIKSSSIGCSKQCHQSDEHVLSNQFNIMLIVTVSIITIGLIVSIYVSIHFYNAYRSN